MRISWAARTLRGAGMAWWLAAAAGQLAFVTFIIRFYGSRTLSGHIERWNDKGLIKGYIPHDDGGNALFGAHALLAALITLAGLAQLFPPLRRAFPQIHRWTGRVFFVIAYFMALSGLWMGWVRGARLSMVSAVATSLNAVLILVFATLAWRFALGRRFEDHRRWAMRTFMVVNGVFFLRIGMMAWVLANHGPLWIGDNLEGPMGAALSFGSYLVPLAALEAYFAAGRSEGPAPKLAAALLVLSLAGVTALGAVGATIVLWRPYY